MNRTTTLLLLAFLLFNPGLVEGASDEAQIRELTEQFRQAIVEGDLSILDRVFDPDPSNVYYDINEGPMVGMERLRRIWQAATRNSRLNRFEFADDMRIQVEGDRALQTSSWIQTQVQQDGSTRDIQGRATILWRKSDGNWRVYHYHGSITPRRSQ